MQSKQIEKYNFSNFTTPQQAFATRLKVRTVLPELFHDGKKWGTYRVLHDDPEVWRIWRQLGNIRVCLHYIFSCDAPFFHFHPWPSVVECLEGGYMQSIGIYNGSVEDIYALEPAQLDAFTNQLVKQDSMIIPGSSYAMTDLRQCHSVQVHDYNVSLMIMGLEYRKGLGKQLSRNDPMPAYLEPDQYAKMIAYGQKHFPLN